MGYVGYRVARLIGLVFVLFFSLMQCVLKRIEPHSPLRRLDTSRPQNPFSSKSEVGGLHVNTATVLHQSFPRLRPIQA